MYVSQELQENARSNSRRGSAGFTLLELMIVITIIVTLLAMGAARYDKAILHSHEAALKQDLFAMRQAIDQYTLDKEQAPGSLDDLVAAQYLRSIPMDPITHQRDWQVVEEDVQLSPDQSGTGITDVHSASEQVSPFDNTAYNTW